MKISPNTLVSLNDEIGIVLGSVDFYKPDLVYNVLVDGKLTTAAYRELSVVNTNYINEPMTASQVLEHFSKEYNSKSTEAQTTINNIVEGAQKMVDNAHNTVIRQLFKDAAKIKVEYKSQKFYFGGLYYTPVHEIEVKEALSQGKQKVATIYFNGVELSIVEIGNLMKLVNLEIGGHKVNDYTMKIGNAIGHTKDIRNAIDFFKSINTHQSIFFD